MKGISKRATRATIARMQPTLRPITAQHMAQVIFVSEPPVPFRPFDEENNGSCSWEVMMAD